ncbi:MAG: VWA domain-containing protein [Phycisphaerae bacterium]|nr:VWA domain-containing protein [Phycisphaerae bacterium]
MVTPRELLVAFLVAAMAALLAALAEWLHARRVRRVERLAFGPKGPAAWTVVVPPLRVLAFALTTWGAMVLVFYTSERTSTKARREASQHLLVALDVSPSMHLADSGPRTGLSSAARTPGATTALAPGSKPERMKRAAWAGELVKGILDRLDPDTTRMSVVAFYSDALPIVTETFEKEVVANILDGLPMYVAFEGGGTNVAKGIEKAFEIARPWPEKSATLVIVSDGDSMDAKLPGRRPDSIADVIVIGVGDPKSALMVGGHRSRQDAESLKRIALQLGGIYHDGNERQLPSSVLDGLSMITPQGADAIGLREMALLAVGVGGGVLAFLGPTLLLFGTRRSSRGPAGPGVRSASTGSSNAERPELSGEKTQERRSVLASGSAR